MKKNRLIITMLLCGLIAFCSSVGVAAPIELSLDDSVALAIRNNLAIKVAQDEQISATWQVKKAEADKLFNITYNHIDKREKTPPSIENYLMYAKWSVLDTTYANNITLNWQLYTGGKVEGSIEQAKINLGIAKQGVRKTEQQVKLDTIIAYFKIIQARNMFKVSQDSVNVLEGHLKNAKIQYEAGTIVKSDVLRSEVELMDTEQKLTKDENSYKVSVVRLNKVIGLSMDTEIIIKDEVKYKKYERSLEEDIKMAISNRPEALQANDKVIFAKQGIKVAESGKMPTVTFQGSSDYYSNKFPGLENDNWSMAIKVSMNIFDAGQVRTEIKMSNTELDKAMQQAKQVREDIEFEVRQAYLDLKEAEKRIETTPVAIDKAEEDFRIAQIRYDAGDCTNLDLIDAQVAMVRVKTNYIQDLYDLNLSRFKLEKATGII